MFRADKAIATSITYDGMASRSVVLPYHSRRLKLIASQPKLGDCTSSTSPTIEGS